MQAVYKTIQLTTKRKHQIIAFEGDSITKEIIKKGEYDSNTLAFMSDVLKLIKPYVSLDIGANIGNHSLVIAGESRRLIAFEPIPFLFEVLANNLKLNHFEHATALNVGLSNISKSAKIFVDRSGNLGSSSITERHGDGDLLDIKLRQGDELLEEIGVEHSVDFIKIDVEGHEAQALLGLEKTITNCQPLILLEWRTDATLSAFEELGLFQKAFSQYQFFSVTKTYSKKIYPKTLTGFIRRLRYKFFNKHWCLCTFDKKKHYANVCFVPPRYQEFFSKLQYLNA
jgi:FkbM family methyltransferase